MSKQEAEDGYDLVEWMAAQPWCDGNVGMVGVSYFGTIQLHVAAEQPPHLKAIMPWNAVGGLLPRGDAPRRHHADLLLRPLHALDARQSGLGDAPRSTRPRSSSERSSERAADPDLRMYTTLWNVVDNPATNPSFFDVLMHPLDGPFYWERSAYTAYDRIEIPFYTALGVVGVRAHAPRAARFGTSTGIDAPRKLEIGPPVDEERAAAAAYDEEVVRWYDHWLKGMDTGIMDEPPIRIC